jgi:hypothetical protein
MKSAWPLAKTPYLWIPILIAIWFLRSSPEAATLLQLDSKLRHRVNEVDTAIALFNTTNSFVWLNLAQSRVAVLAGYFPKFKDFAYTGTTGDSTWFVLPTNFREVKKVFVKSKKRLYPILPSPGLASDTGKMTYDVIWKEEDTAHLIMKLGGFQDKQTNIIFSPDSSTYRLPVDFRNLMGIMVWSGQWEPVQFSPLFGGDGTRLCDIHWKARDSALLYLRGNFAEGDSVRIFYQKTLDTNDTVRVEYVSIPSDMLTADSVCHVPDDLEGFVIEEALGYYFAFKQDFQNSQATWERVRIDMGLIQPRKQ